MGDVARWRLGRWLLAVGCVWASACGESERRHQGSGSHAARAGASQAGATSAGLGGSAGLRGRDTGGAGGSDARGGRSGSGAGPSGESGDGGEHTATGGLSTSGGNSGGRPPGETAGDGGDNEPSAGQNGAGQGGAGEGGSRNLDCHAEPDPTPALPASVDLDPDAVARAAVVLGSCVPDDGVDRNAEFFWRANSTAAHGYFRYGTQLACLADARCGCDALEQCVGLRLSKATACAPHCDGDEFVVCGGDFDLPDVYDARVDCGRLGLSCDPDASCTDGLALACDETPFGSTCTSDDRQESCSDGVLRQTPACSTLGLACADGYCTGAGAECESGSSPFGGDVINFEGLGCSGNVLDICANGRTSSLDCATQGPGFGCQELNGAYFCGLASECVPARVGSASPSHPPSCDGSVLTFCNAGRLEHVDCTSLGFTGCEIARSMGLYGCTPSQTHP